MSGRTGWGRRIRQRGQGLISAGSWGKPFVLTEDLEKYRVCLFTEKPFEGTKKPAVIICPEGGYENLSVNGEGFRMAEVLKKAGYHPFVLTYRLKPNF